MYRKIDESMTNVLGFKLSGELTTDEIEAMAGEIAATIEDCGKIRLVLEIEDLQEAPEVLSLAVDHSFASRFDNRVERMACLADPKWRRWWDKLAATFVTTATMFFTPNQRQAGLDWIRAGRPD